jgi:hypothetical protein
MNSFLIENIIASYFKEIARWEAELKSFLLSAYIALKLF